MTLSAAARRVIDLADKVRAYYAAELPKRHPNYPLVEADDDGVPPPPEEKALGDFLATLPPDLTYQLLLLVALERGEVGAADIGRHYEELKHSFSDPRAAAAELMAYKATLADELTDGLAELRTHKLDVDRLPLKRVPVRKR